MIYESFYWKKELYNCYLTLAKFRHLQKKFENSFVKAEKALMIGAYVIRKLDDAQKIPPDLLGNKELIEFLKNKDTTVDHLNWHRIDTHYEFEKYRKLEQDWRFIINQIIHSFSFIFSFNDLDKLENILINSDNTKRKTLFVLPVKTIFMIFLTISEGDITSAHMLRSKSGEMKLIDAIYSYPQNFDLNKILSDTMNGNIYIRSKD